MSYIPLLDTILVLAKVAKKESFPDT
jgi:hypothetical protein